MISSFVKFNLKLSRLLARKFPNFFLDVRSFRNDLITMIKKSFSDFENLRILEIGGIDRPLLKKSNKYHYCGLDIEYKKNCNELYDEFNVQSIEHPLINNYSIIISTTLLEHVKDNKKSFQNIYNSLIDGGKTFHYIPSKNHFYSLILRIVGPKLQKIIIKNLRPQASLEITGYPAFFDLCSPYELKKVLLDTGFKNIKIVPYYKAGDYFAFFTPLYVIVSVLENLCEKFNLRYFASGLIISAEKNKVSLSDSDQLNAYLNYHIYLRKKTTLGFLYRKLFLCPLLRLLLGRKYIDLGCGVGSMIQLSPKYSIGLDVNRYNIEYIISKGLKAKLIGEEGKFPLEDSSYPALICDNVIEHIQNPEILIKEIKRVLYKDGRLLLGVPLEKGYLRDKDHKVFYDVKKISDLFCNKYDFTINYYFYFPIPFKFAGKFFRQQSLYILLKNNK